MPSAELQTDIVVLGGGMGGYAACRTLIRQLAKQGLGHRVLLIDKNNYCTFVPMLHEVVSGAIEPGHLAAPLRELVYTTGHSFLKATIQHIDPAAKTITTDKGVVRYREYCVVALGSGVNYFGVPGAAEYSYHIRTLPMVRRLQRDFILALEGGERELHFVVVGAGYTGVELAGNMGRYVNRDIHKLYPDSRVHITLVENGPSILYQLPAAVQRKAAERLKREGITIHCCQPVTEVLPDGVKVNGDIIKSDFTVWCSGVRNLADQFLPAQFVDKGRIPVTPYLHSPRDERLYVIGDIALGQTEKGVIYPQLGAVAYQQAAYVGRRIAQSLARPRAALGKPFRLFHKGILIPVGKWYGVGVFGDVVLAGKLMWLLRCVVYLLYIPGWGRKIKIAMDWLLHSRWFRYIILIERVNAEALQHRQPSAKQ